MHSYIKCKIIGYVDRSHRFRQSSKRKIPGGSRKFPPSSSLLGCYRVPAYFLEPLPSAPLVPRSPRLNFVQAPLRRHRQLPALETPKKSESSPHPELVYRPADINDLKAALLATYCPPPPPTPRISQGDPAFLGVLLADGVRAMAHDLRGGGLECAALSLGELKLEAVTKKIDNAVEIGKQADATRVRLEAIVADFNLLIRRIALLNPEERTQNHLAIKQQCLGFQERMERAVRSSESVFSSMSPSFATSIALARKSFPRLLGAEPMEPKIAPVNFPALMQSLVRPGVTLSSDRPKDPSPSIHFSEAPTDMDTDGVFVAHAALNLILNAKDHAKSDVRLTSFLAEAPGHRVAVVGVCNQGAGMTESALQNSSFTPNTKTRRLLSSTDVKHHGLGTGNASTNIQAINRMIDPAAKDPYCALGVAAVTAASASDPALSTLPDGPLTQPLIDFAKSQFGPSGTMAYMMLVTRPVAAALPRPVAVPKGDAARAKEIGANKALVKAHFEKINQERTKAGKPGLRVLVVEDMEINQKIATRTLAAVGLQVQIAGTGRDAVKMVQSSTAEPFDCVFMDNLMPGELTGFRTSEELRDVCRYSGPIFLNSADPLTVAISSKGMNGELPKPLVAADVYAMLITWLGV